jgi:hypothetical protein
MANLQHKRILLQLKKQVRLLRRKEEKSRQQLQLALKKMHKLGKSYKSKLAGKMRILKDKLATVQSTSYAKAVADLERKLLKSLETKARALAQAVQRVEQKHAVKLSKNLMQKAKMKLRKYRVKKLK